MHQLKFNTGQIVTHCDILLTFWIFFLLDTQPLEWISITLTIQLLVTMAICHMLPNETTMKYQQNNGHLAMFAIKFLLAFLMHIILCSRHPFLHTFSHCSIIFVLCTVQHNNSPFAKSGELYTSSAFIHNDKTF